MFQVLKTKSISFKMNVSAPYDGTIRTHFRGATITFEPPILQYYTIRYYTIRTVSVGRYCRAESR
jgi:hypothetical protein